MRKLNAYYIYFILIVGAIFIYGCEQGMITQEDSYLQGHQSVSENELDESNVLTSSGSIHVLSSPPITPNVSQSVQNGHPYLTWNSVAGADFYEIEILYNYPGHCGLTTDWCPRTLTSSTSFTDTQFDGATVIYTPSGDWIAYRVRAVNQYGSSAWDLEKYFSYDP